MFTRSFFGKVNVALFLVAGIAALAVKEAAAETLNACCLPDGTCQDSLTPAACEGLGGMSFWACSTCEEVDCPNPGCIGATGSCHSAHSTPGCDHVQICDQTCSLYPQCCEEEWNDYCAEHATIADFPAITTCCLPDGSCVVMGAILQCYYAGGFHTEGPGPEQCHGDADGDGIDDGCPCGEAEPIPTVSAWGLLVMTLLLMTGIKIKFGRRGARAAAGRAGEVV